MDEDEREDAFQGIPKIRLLVVLEFYLGVPWASPSLGFFHSLLHSPSNPYPKHENFSHTKLKKTFVRSISIHYCRMLLTRHYDQRPFDETVCDATIANGGVKNRQKRCQTFAMTDVSNTVQILVACVIQGIRFSSINCLR